MLLMFQHVSFKTTKLEQEDGIRLPCTIFFLPHKACLYSVFGEKLNLMIQKFLGFCPVQHFY